MLSRPISVFSIHVRARVSRAHIWEEMAGGRFFSLVAPMSGLRARQSGNITTSRCLRSPTCIAPLKPFNLVSLFGKGLIQCCRSLCGAG